MIGVLILLSFTQLKSSYDLGCLMRCERCSQESGGIIDWGLDPLTKQEWVTFYCDKCEHEFTRWIVQW